MVVRWKFEDLTDDTEWVFEINPSEGGSPEYDKNVSYENTSGPDGKAIIFEGQDPPKKLNFTGTILYESAYTAFVTWWEKRHQIRLTDDLNRVSMVYVKSFKPTRKRSATYPWKHDYSCELTVLDWDI